LGSIVRKELKDKDAFFPVIIVIVIDLIYWRAGNFFYHLHSSTSTTYELITYSNRFISKSAKRLAAKDSWETPNHSKNNNSNDALIKYSDSTVREEK